ncbi:hypothetical protein ACX122_07830 [Kosakonia cowanii]|uniref:hypothetical protein n=1 Tax=Kosakonia cowanii TaxID=208223 RepID=UPI002DDD91D2|nr:hypothetical protein [Kosakonia cowanii]MBS5771814.1 hypothetical protein [Enterobacter cloacae]WRY58885.1 hypothetical protein P8F81_20070 [Kosakonia cowanii]
MKYLFFTIFLLITLFYIWNGKDQFNKKDWLAFFIKFILVALGAFVWGAILAFTLKFFPTLGYDNMLSLSVIIPASFMAILFCKLFVVMLCAIFAMILNFHKNHNTQVNYSKISLFFTRLGPNALIFAKCVVSVAAILMFYGIWLADAA